VLTIGFRRNRRLLLKALRRTQNPSRLPTDRQQEHLLSADRSFSVAFSNRRSIVVDVASTDRRCIVVLISIRCTNLASASVPMTTSAQPICNSFHLPFAWHILAVLALFYVSLNNQSKFVQYYMSQSNRRRLYIELMCDNHTLLLLSATHNERAPVLKTTIRSKK